MSQPVLTALEKEQKGEIKKQDFFVAVSDTFDRKDTSQFVKAL